MAIRLLWGGLLLLALIRPGPAVALSCIFPNNSYSVCTATGCAPLLATMSRPLNDACSSVPEHVALSSEASSAIAALTAARLRAQGGLPGPADPPVVVKLWSPHRGGFREDALQRAIDQEGRGLLEEGSYVLEALKAPEGLRDEAETRAWLDDQIAAEARRSRVARWLPAALVLAFALITWSALVWRGAPGGAPLGSAAPLALVHVVLGLLVVLSAGSLYSPSLALSGLLLLCAGAGMAIARRRGVRP